MEFPVVILNDDDSVEERLHGDPAPDVPTVPANSTPRTRRSPGNPQATSGSTNDSPLLVSHKKRKRAIFTPSPKSQKSQKILENSILNDDDDGATCPICLDHWDMSGDHRLTALKCGHLFGASCIRRWLQECPTGAKCCPTCKNKATPRDFRYLFAKRLCAVDNTELESLKLLLNEKTTDFVKLTSEKNLLDFELQHNRQRLVQLQEENDYLKRRLTNPSSSVAASSQSQVDAGIRRLKNMRLFLHKKIDISQDVAGCRFMASSRSNRLLFVSQKSPQTMFPGFGVRYVDLDSLKTTNFVHVTAKQISDIVVSDYAENKPNVLLTAAMETSARLFDVSSRTAVQTFKPASNGGPEEQLVCCGFGDKDTLYLGGQRGTVFQFDRRNASQHRTSVKFPMDNSPVRNVAYVPCSQDLPHGGLLVCTLRELSFYPFADAGQVETGMRGTINVSGPFSSMSYDALTGFVLITTRSSASGPESKYIMARFEKLPNGSVALVVKHTFSGSSVMPVQSRPVQYQVNGTDSVLLSAYLQSTRMLTTWSVENNLRIQEMSVSDTIIDMCPVYLTGVRHVAALSDNRCRIFQLHEDRV